MTQYELSRNWFDWCFENPEKISPTHTAIYFFAIEHCNRLGWKAKFGFPTQMSMEALGIKKHQTYIKYLHDLCNWGFIEMLQESKNQYSANIISISHALPKNGKALDKALVNHAAKQGQSTGQSKVPIDKQITNNQITTLTEGEPPEFSKTQTLSFNELVFSFTEQHQLWIENLKMNDKRLESDAHVISLMKEFCLVLKNADQYPVSLKEAKNRFAGWKDKKLSGIKEVNNNSNKLSTKYV